MNKAESKYFNTAVKFDEALLALLETKPFAYITVSEVCKKAGVNRSTFYLHYENTQDLLEEATQHFIGVFLSYFSVERQDIVLKFQESGASELNFIDARYLHPYLSFIRDNQRVFLTMLTQSVTFRSEQIFQRLYQFIFDPILERFQYPPSERKYVMMFYLNGITAITTEWVKEGCQKSIEEITQIIRYCIFGREDHWSIREEEKE